MKVKKIEWIGSVRFDSSGRCKAEMALGHHAYVTLSMYSEEWYWAIIQRNQGIASGYAKTKEMAQRDCQAAWERMVMEALEQSEGCEFCRDRIVHAGRGAIISIFESKRDSVQSSMRVRAGGAVCQFSAKYCFNCGRKLGR